MYLVKYKDRKPRHESLVLSLFWWLFLEDQQFVQIFLGWKPPYCLLALSTFAAQIGNIIMKISVLCRMKKLYYRRFFSIHLILKLKWTLSNVVIDKNLKSLFILFQFCCGRVSLPVAQGRQSRPVCGGVRREWFGQDWGCQDGASLHHGDLVCGGLHPGAAASVCSVTRRCVWGAIPPLR